MGSKKNIWIFCHYAQQPPFNTMLRYHNWGKELVKRNYDITIVAASTVHNTDIDVVDKIGSNKSICEGITYRYIKTPKYSGNGLARIKNMMTYNLGLRKNLKTEKEPDIVIVCEAYLYLFARRMFKNTPIITDIVDLWPESIIEYANVNKKNLLVQFLYKIEKKVYLKTNALVFSMEGGKDYLKEQKYRNKIDYEKVFHINMGCNIKEVDENKINSEELLTWDFNKFNLVYCGSVRKANNIKQICDAAQELQNRNINNIEIHIYGNGDELEYLQSYVTENKIKNVKFYGRIEKAKIAHILSNSTANILTYKQVNLMKYGGSQSKLFDYLSSGRPIICNAKFGYNLITRYDCGIVTENQTAVAFADAVEKLCSFDKVKLEKMGNNARHAAEDYDQPILVDELCKVFNYLERK